MRSPLPHTQIGLQLKPPVFYTDLVVYWQALRAFEPFSLSIHVSLQKTPLHSGTGSLMLRKRDKITYQGGGGGGGG